MPGMKVPNWSFGSLSEPWPTAPMLLFALLAGLPAPISALPVLGV